MSKLREKLAEIMPYNDEYDVDSETGELVPKSQKPEDGAGETKNQTWQDKMKNLTKQTKPTAKETFNDQRFKNMWGTVSPLKIVFREIDKFSTMPKEEAINGIMTALENLNKEWCGDEGFDCLTKEYLNKLKYKLTNGTPKQKSRTTDDVIILFGDSVLNGDGLGTGPKKPGSKKRAEEEDNSLETFANTLDQKLKEKFKK